DLGHLEAGTQPPVSAGGVQRHGGPAGVHRHRLVAQRRPAVPAMGRGAPEGAYEPEQNDRPELPLSAERHRADAYGAALPQDGADAVAAAHSQRAQHVLPADLYRRPPARARSESILE